jgi:hypothetical protein
MPKIVPYGADEALMIDRFGDLRQSSGETDSVQTELDVGADGIPEHVREFLKIFIASGRQSALR